MAAQSSTSSLSSSSLNQSKSFAPKAAMSADAAEFQPTTIQIPVVYGAEQQLVHGFRNLNFRGGNRYQQRSGYGRNQQHNRQYTTQPSYFESGLFDKDKRQNQINSIYKAAGVLPWCISENDEVLLLLGKEDRSTIKKKGYRHETPEQIKSSWLHFGGKKMDQDSDCEATALREFVEETGETLQSRIEELKQVLTECPRAWWDGGRYVLFLPQIKYSEDVVNTFNSLNKEQKKKDCKYQEIQWVNVSQFFESLYDRSKPLVIKGEESHIASFFASLVKSCRIKTFFNRSQGKQEPAEQQNANEQEEQATEQQEQKQGAQSQQQQEQKEEEQQVPPEHQNGGIEKEAPQ